jgi:hypothetical protein
MKDALYRGFELVNRNLPKVASRLVKGNTPPIKTIGSS